jgi:hypothetical protein
MAGKIVADQIEHSTAGSLDTSYVVQGSAKAWVNFNGNNAIATRDSLNLSSLTDNGTGDYTTNFSNAFDTGNYATFYGRSIDSSAYPGGGLVVAGHITTSMRFIPQRSTGGVNFDTELAMANNHGDLA